MTTKLQSLMDKHRKLVASYGRTEYEFSEDIEMDREFFMSAVSKVMKSIRSSKIFAYGLSLTWRNVAGYTAFETKMASVLIDKITPDADFTIDIYKTGERGIYEVITYHHDKPMGESIYLMSQSMAKKKQIMETYFTRP